MKRTPSPLLLILFASLLALAAQLPAQSASPMRPAALPAEPFSHIAFGGGFSPLGIQLSTATNVSRYLNVRGTGNFFHFTDSNISTNGFMVDAKLNFASAAVSADLYPFPNRGFRLSPGLLFYNQNGAGATFNVKGGTSFTLNDTTYYASSTNPVMGGGNLSLNARKPAFMLTTGWGNMIPRGGRHWAFPVEIGVAFIGAPALNIALTSGQVCDAQGLNCVNVATDPNVQANLQTQVAKDRSDLDPLKTYPIVSAGVAYSFHLRRQ